MALATRIPVKKAARYSHFASADDPIVAHLATSDRAVSNIARWKSGRHAGVTLDSKRAVENAHADGLHAKCDGRGLQSASLVPGVHTWVRGGTKLITGRHFINALKVRGNLIATKERNNRGRVIVPGTDFCDAGCRIKESLGHVVQGCARTHGVRIQRHDLILDKLGEMLRWKGHVVAREPCIPTPQGVRFPDQIILANDHAAASPRLYVADVQIVSDSWTAGHLSHYHRLKVEKYCTQPIKDWVRHWARSLPNRGDLPAVPPDACVKVSSFTSSFRGCLAAESAACIKSLGITQGELELLSVEVLRGSARIASFHRHTTGRGLGAGVAQLEQ